MRVAANHLRGKVLIVASLSAAFLWTEPGLVAQDYASNIVSRHVLTNDGIVTLAKAGFDELFIVERIRTSRAKFDTSVEGLVALKQAGLSEDVIRVMAQRDNLEYKRLARLSYFATPVADAAAAAGITNPAPLEPPSPPPPPTPIVTEKHWWIFRWIRVSY